MRRVSFSDFLDGVRIPNYQPSLPDNVTPTEMKNGLLENPIQFWANHVAFAISDLGLSYIHFEDLVRKPKETLENLAHKQGLKLKKEPERIKKLVGHHPRKGVIGDWVNHFSDDDLNVFDLLAGDIMREFGYYR
jgi:hypothetical protein